MISVLDQTVAELLGFEAWPTREAIERIANRMTYSRAKAEVLGFRLHRVMLADEQSDGFSFRQRVDFECVCGRREHFAGRRYTRFPHDVAQMDIAAEIWKFGSFSRDHLIADGFTPEQCDEFERKAIEFDRTYRNAQQETQS